MTNYAGLDPSLTSTGLAISTWTRALTPPTAMRSLARIRWLEVELCVALEDEVPPKPSDFTVAIEGPSFGSSGRGQHERGGLWWHLVNHLDNLGANVVIVPPTVLKKYATGKGNAGKDAVLLACARRFEWFTGGNDEADALWLCAIAAELAGAPIVDMPKANRGDLAAKVSRP